MTTHTFNYPLFQQQIPAYASSPAQSVIEAYWETGTAYISADDACGGLQGAALDLALNLLAAHLAYINGLIANGQDTVVVTGSTIDKVSVTLLAPPVKGMFQFWLATSPYGKQLLAMLAVKSAGGWSITKGIPERRAFRKGGGTFR